MIVSEELTTPLQCVVGESKAAIISLASQQWISNAVVSGVSKYLEPPHKAPDLEKNVDEFLKTFQETVVDRWNQEIFDAIQ